MIQRIQTVYLFLGVVLSIVCLCMQIGEYHSGALLLSRMYNLCSIRDNGAVSFNRWPLFVVLLLSVSVCIYAIFCYRNRKVQSRLCLFSSLLVAGWYALYAVYAYVICNDSAGKHFSMLLPAGLPFLSMVFYLLARRAINADERLVRAADRIR